MGRGYTAEHRELLGTDDMNDGWMKAHSAAGHEVLVGAARLGDGKLEGATVTCPRHSSHSDLRHGHVVRWTDWPAVKLRMAELPKSPRPLTTRPAKVKRYRVLDNI